jgi:AraC family transcriptional regulator of adaptative response / DNA-3-methyladenine glycosylase II
MHVRKPPLAAARIRYGNRMHDGLMDSASPAGLPSDEVCERARLARDARYDGRFFVGVLTTGIYCRPVCPARAPAQKNVRYFASAAAASLAGLRPCLRCRPESAPGSAAWRGTSAVVGRALHLIDDGALDTGSVDELAERLGITARHLHRLFLQHVGAGPQAVAITRRLHFAKQLLDDTRMSVSDIATAAGFGSQRQLHALVQRTWGRSPRDLRAAASRATRAAHATATDPDHGLRLRLTARPPFDGAAVCAWLAPRLVPGVESVDSTGSAHSGDVPGYARRLPGGGELRVRVHAYGVEVGLAGVRPERLLELTGRVRRMFDLACDPDAVAAVLGRDPLLAPLLRRWPGTRIPGAWDGYELAVRAVLGQQVSVAAATTLAGRLAAQAGGDAGYPAPDRLADVSDTALGQIGIPARRGQALRALAAAAAAGRLDFSAPERLRAELLTLPGIGPWTAEYIALRGAGDPDAFPASDLGLRKALGLALAPDGPPVSERALAARAEQWRPWRGYAAMLLWRSLGAGG